MQSAGEHALQLYLHSLNKLEESTGVVGCADLPGVFSNCSVDDNHLINI